MRTTLLFYMNHPNRSRIRYAWDHTTVGGNVQVTQLLLPRRSYALGVEHSGIKNTYPSSSKPPSESKHAPSDGDRGYLAFTKASLFKLTLPLFPPHPDPSSPASKASSPAAKRKQEDDLHSNDSVPKASFSDDKSNTEKVDSSQPWEQQVEDGKDNVSQVQHKRGFHDSEHDKPADDEADSEEFDANAPAQSVVFLLHSGQPLSYIENLIRAEGPSPEPDPRRGRGENSIPISFHTRDAQDKRWSASTGIGDFLRDAARLGSFFIFIGGRKVEVNVPSFEDRTRFLREDLHEKTHEIQRLSIIKDECDDLAKKTTQKVAFGVAGLMGSWWIAVGYFTFRTSLGWDTMEPITYLTSLGTVISGYLWFLWHNREVSYRTVLTETTSKRQHRLYIERGFNVEHYHELIDEVKDIRKAIKRVAWDYDLSWEQGNTKQGKKAGRALEIVRKEEDREASVRRNRKVREDNVDNQRDEDGDEKRDVDDDGDVRRSVFDDQNARV